jgi:hypothetical protein
LTDRLWHVQNEIEAKTNNNSNNENNDNELQLSLLRTQEEILIGCIQHLVCIFLISMIFLYTYKKKINQTFSKNLGFFC